MCQYFIFNCWIILYYMDRPLFIYPFSSCWTFEWTPLFWLLWTMNSAAVRRWVQSFLWTSVFISLEFVPWSGVSRSHDKSVFHVWDTGIWHISASVYIQCVHCDSVNSIVLSWVIQWPWIHFLFFKPFNFVLGWKVVVESREYTGILGPRRRRIQSGARDEAWSLRAFV